MSHPQQLGKYLITGLVGEGAMGIVYRGLDPVIKRTVAIKMLRQRLIEQGAAGASLAARFRNEAQAAGRLMHSGIVAVHDYGEDALGPYIVMEYVEGATLRDHLRQQRRFDDAEIVGLMGQLLDALHYAHEQGVWHRDIKPANLILTPAGRLKVADFGIARIETVGLTQVSSSIGTPGHMAPEQYTGDQVDRRADIFACGVLLYQLLTARSPFGGSNENVMFQTLNSDPMPPSRVSSAERPGWFDALVATAMAKRPEDRYPTALLFKQALLSRGRAVLDIEMPVTQVPPPPPRFVATPANETAEPGSAHPSSASGSRWNPDTLSRFESELALMLGPLARVLVRRAAKESTDVASLRTRLAAELTTAGERDSFLRRTEGTPVAAGGTFGSQGSGGATRRHDDTLIGENVVRRAERALAHHVGPIARVLTAQAAAQAQSRQDFFARLLDHVETDAGRHQLRQALQQLGS
ncbi:serine/threonine-protein kinase [Caldimonas brevitalea]|uniref:Serine/threonine protein kinase n=1 Tax=Caldimonas brevitalea TaxID=413882 RepID=A0A0G3BKE8_9BURK|nr:serine/threonine-protein kinase [Caldimonas brevitalea]AKJ27836.1 serine/threonine protein kinase [Caldimonas brevitalea]